MGRKPGLQSKRRDETFIAARQAEIVGKPQRIDPPDDGAISEESLAVIARIRTAIGLPIDAELPEYCLTIAKHPSLFRCQMDTGTAIFRGVLPPRERELAVLRIAWLLGAPYEWGEHVDIGKRNGVERDEIERVIEGSAAPGWSEHEAAILGAVEEMIADQTISDATWTALAGRWNEQQLLEFPMVVGQYVAIALIQNALRIRLAPDNPGLPHR